MVDAIEARKFINCSFGLIDDTLVRLALSPSMLAISISHVICDLMALNALLAEVTTLNNGSKFSAIEREYFDSNVGASHCTVIQSFSGQPTLKTPQHGVSLKILSFTGRTEEHLY